MLITVSGLPGSGTTTASRLIAHDLELQHVYAGEIFRKLAVERNLTLEEFGQYAEEHPEVDWELDRRMARRARELDCVLEGRLTGWITHREDIKALRVWLDCPEEVRAERVAEREGITKDKALKDNSVREASENKRFLDIYEIDLTDRSIYDLVLDSNDLRPEEIASTVGEAAKERFSDA